MPTTTITDATMSVSAVGSRTDSAGAAVTDYTAEEVRFAQQILTEGYVSPAAAFKVTAQTVPNMTVKVGSGTARADYYVVAGDAAGQGNYIVRLDVTSQNVTISAADASQARTDEVYLYVADTAYDASSRVLPRLAYRKGDLGGANPGPDATWKAYVLLARVAVAANATTITNANITDTRAQATMALPPSGSGIGVPRTFVLASDVSAPSTSLVSAFSIPITETGRYIVEAFLWYGADPSPGIRFWWTAPSGTTGKWSSGGVLKSTGQRIGSLDMGMVDFPSVSLSVTGDGAGPAIEVGARPVAHALVTNTGTLTMSISQDTSSGFTSVLRAGSSVRVTRVA